MKVRVGDQVRVLLHCNDCSSPGTQVRHPFRAWVIDASAFLSPSTADVACKLRLIARPLCKSVARQAPRGITFANASSLSHVDAVTLLGELAE